MGREVQKEGAYVYLWLIHVDLWQKPIQFCKAIILQLKINKFKIKKKKRDQPQEGRAFGYLVHGTKDIF